MSLKIYDENPFKAVKRAVAVLSGKGGVGKSTVCASLAITFRRLQQNCGLLDADLYGPSIRHMLREEELPREEEGKVVPALCRGIKYISMAHFRLPEEGTIIRAPIANQLIDRFSRGVIWGDLDWLFVDFPPGTGDISVSLLQKIPFSGAVIVTTPQEIALLDVQKTLDMLKKMGVPVLGVIENMSSYRDPSSGNVSYPFGKDGAKRFAASAGVPFLGEIPLDPTLRQSCDKGEIVPSEAIEKIVRNIRGHLLAEDKQPQVSKKDDKHLFIDWGDKTTTKISFWKLQNKCPCAACLQGALRPDEHLSINKLKWVGRYALTFEFTSGCSQGIYPLNYIRNLGERHV